MRSLRVLAQVAHVDALRERAQGRAVLLVVVHHVRCLHGLLVIMTRIHVADVVVAAEAVVIARAETTFSAVGAKAAGRTVIVTDVFGQLLIDAAAALVAGLARNSQIHLAHGLGVVVHVRLGIHAILALGLLVGQWAWHLADLRAVKAEVGS